MTKQDDIASLSYSADLVVLDAGSITQRLGFVWWVRNVLPLLGVGWLETSRCHIRCFLHGDPFTDAKFRFELICTACDKIRVVQVRVFCNPEVTTAHLLHPFSSSGARRKVDEIERVQGADAYLSDLIMVSLECFNIDTDKYYVPIESVRSWQADVQRWHFDTGGNFISLLSFLCILP